MINVTLPDGSKKEFDAPVSIYSIAKNIGDGLAKSAVAGKIGKNVYDISYEVDSDINLKIITLADTEGLEILRHSSAHLLAQAVKELFPSAQVAIGPVIENGFYYDFYYEKGFNEGDLVKIEKKMQEIAKRKLAISRDELSRNDVIKLFENVSENYKVKIIQEIAEEEKLSIYRQGDFFDLCRGPHLPNTSFIKAFKLTKVSGAYWKGDSKNEMLQRIYGTAFPSKKELTAYLEQIKEAEKRDHRKLGKQLDLFHFQEEAPGMCFWHPKGWTVYKIIKDYVSNLLQENGYQEVNTPMIVDKKLWERSGHWEIFGSEMFITETENHAYAIKPMSCPCHVQIFNQGLKSYRDLPLRISEFGSCHRSEYSGALHGLMRVRGFVQDDGHIFCTHEQLQHEVDKFIDLLYQIYKDFGFNEVILKLATRPDERVGDDSIWDKAEKSLQQALESKKLKFSISEGEGAFYGPKIEFSLKDCLGRVWQCGTMQVDFSMPERLNAQYINVSGNKEYVVMLHRAIFGSFERFIGILIENYAGNLPLWLAPIQAVVLNITDDQVDYSKNIVNQLKQYGIRADSDLRNEKIGYKIREHAVCRVPYLLIVGKQELESKTVSVRMQNGDDLGTMRVDEFADHILKLVEAKS
ncbi:MAG: threonine--tRNA ligase [Legionellales bacterium]|nr:threonine--tRNA ligase [Legionellales bacterium]